MKRIIFIIIFLFVVWLPPCTCLSFQYAYRHYSGEIEWAVNDVAILEEMNLFFVGDENLVIYRQDYEPFSGKEIVAVQINILGDDSEIVTEFEGSLQVREAEGWDPRVFDGEGYYWYDYGPYLSPVSSVVRITTNNYGRVILDDGNRPPPEAKAVPTLNEWGLIIFGLLLVGSAVCFIWRRKKTN